MKKNILKFKTFIAPLLFCLFVSSSAYSAVIEVSGTSLPGFLGKEISKIRVYAANPQGKLDSIPFQIDERSSNGENSWALDTSLGNGRLDPQDVLLFMDSDSGKGVDPAQWPTAKPRLELALDPQGAKMVYVDFEDPPSALSSKSYVHYDAQQDQVDTSAYTMVFSKSTPLIQNKLVIKNQSGQLNILDRFKVRLKLAIKNFFDFNINEEGISSSLVGVRAGPIRIIRRLEAYKKIGPIGFIPKSYVDFLFYSDWMQVPSKIKNPIDGPKILNDKTSGLSGYDFSKNILGSQFYSNLNSSPISLDGKTSEREQNSLKGIIKWWAVSGNQGSLVVGVKNDPQLVKLGIEPALQLIDDITHPKPPESEAGEIFIGLDLPYYKIPKGNYLLLVRMAFPDHFVHGMEENILASAKTVAPNYVRDLP